MPWRVAANRSTKTTGPTRLILRPLGNCTSSTPNPHTMRRLLPFVHSRAVLSFPSAFVLALPARAQNCVQTIGPMGPSFPPSQSVNYDQFWAVPAKSPAGWSFAFTNGDDIYARHFDSYLNPLTDQFLVNTTMTLGTQDEPAIEYATDGSFLVVWSDRNGYDGDLMGVFGRIYNSRGNPIGTEFCLSQTTAQSQWRPLITANPAGGWVVAWSGDADGNAYIRYLATNGTFLSGEILVNTYLFDGQVDTVAAVNPQGITFVAFLDFSAHGGLGTGINLWGRTYDASYNPREPSEFLLTTFTSNGDQRDPRVATDGQGRFFVVWSDQLGDGNAWGIFERVFDATGAPIGPEFQVNTTVVGDQKIPQIRADAVGRTIVVWQDESQGVGAYQVRGRLFAPDLTPLGPEFPMNDAPTFGAQLPFLAADATTMNFVVGWQALGAQTDMDIYGRWFQSTSGPQSYCSPKTNSLGCQPRIDYVGVPSASSNSPFLITGANVLNRKRGLLLYGYGSKFTPYQGSQICVAPPLKRLAMQNSAGSASGSDCSGVFSTDFNARIRSGADPLLVPGATISARWYYRDPQDPAGFSSGLTDALRFAICP